MWKNKTKQTICINETGESVVIRLCQIKHQDYDIRRFEHKLPDEDGINDFGNMDVLGGHLTTSFKIFIILSPEVLPGIYYNHRHIRLFWQHFDLLYNWNTILVLKVSRSLSNQTTMCNAVIISGL